MPNQISKNGVFGSISERDPSNEHFAAAFGGNDELFSVTTPLMG